MVVPQVTHIALDFQHVAGVSICAILHDACRRILRHVRSHGQADADRTRTRRPLGARFPRGSETSLGAAEDWSRDKSPLPRGFGRVVEAPGAPRGPLCDTSRMG